MDNEQGFTGWLLPNGSLIECGNGDHLDIALSRGERHPDAVGWIHYEGGVSAFAAEITNRQVDVMVQMVLSATRPDLKHLPWWLDDAEVVRYNVGGGFR